MRLDNIGNIEANGQDPVLILTKNKVKKAVTRNTRVSHIDIMAYYEYIVNILGWSITKMSERMEIIRLNEDVAETISTNVIQYWIVEFERQTPVMLHHVVNPGSGEKFSYIHQVSTWAFDRYETNRAFGKGAPHSAPFHFELHTQRTYEYCIENPEYYNPFKGLVIQESGTIFDFYKKIGFDHKKRRHSDKVSSIA